MAFEAVFRLLYYLKKRWLSFQYHYVHDKERRLAPKRHPNRALCEALLRQLSAVHFRTYAPGVGLGLVFNPLYPNIERYTQKLNDTLRLLQEERPVPNTWVTEEETPISFDRFLTSDDGYYLDVPDAIARFQHAALAVCDAMRASDTATVGLAEHNLRMLTRLFINLREVITMLVEISLAT